MRVSPILNPLGGERVVGVDPPLAPAAPADWRRRLNLFTGRALSDTALTIEQAGRAGRLATRGQLVSPGVVAGLEIGLERETGANGGARFYYDIAAGFGIAASGEDVVVPKPLRVGVRDLPVYAPAALLDGKGAAGTPGTRDALSAGVPAARRLGRPLGELIEGPYALPPPGLPRAGVVVLEPVVLEVIGELDPTDRCEQDLDDPCEQDPSSYAFEDWQRADGCRLVFYAWPAEWLTLPPAGERWRNRLAYAIFKAEQPLGPDQRLPWEEVGIPIGLVGFDEAWVPLFVDRYSVVRAGGKPKRRTGLLANAGNPFLWQARIQQFAEQLADPDLANVPADTLAGQFHYLPPAGLLPRDAIDPRAGRDDFFPSSYHVEAAPVPLEQLDLAIEASASLAPFDTLAPDPDRVQVLVPVPQEWYEPRLLAIETVDPEFQQTINAFVTRRGKWLLRRSDLRAKAGAIHRAITGEERRFPDPDPDRLEEEAVATDPLDPADELLKTPEGDYGTTLEGGARVVTAFGQLRNDLRTKTPVKSETSAGLDALPTGLTFPAPLSDKVRFDATQKLLIFRGAMTEAERTALLALSANSAYQATVQQLFARSQDDELTQLDRLGVERFIDFLSDKVNRANDTIDFGFLRVQTDIYRLRQTMLGNVAATRLATSPVLASIAKGETAAVTREALNAYLQAAKGTDLAPPSSAPAGPTASGTGPSAAAQPAPAGLSQPLAKDLFVSGELGGSFPETSLSGGGAGGVLFRLPGTSIEGLALTREPSIGEVLDRETTVGAPELFQPRVTPDDVIEQLPIVGQPIDLRTSTIAERLEPAAAPQAKSFTLASKYEVITGLANLSIAVDDLAVPGFREGTEDVTKDFRTIKEENLAGQILQGQHDPNPVNGTDEAAFVAAGVKALENSVATLRVVEGRVQAYRRAIELCRATLKILRGLAGQVDLRLGVIGDELAEARHDVAVARALLAEETARVAAINGRRDRIIADHVTFLAFHRPRVSDLLVQTPVRAIDPGLVEAAVPACFRRAVTPPPELRAMVDLLREVPVRWLTNVPPLLDRLDRLEILQETIHSAKLRAQTRDATSLSAGQALAQGGLFAQALDKVVTAQRQVVGQHREHTAQLDLSVLAGQSWTISRDRAKDTVSLGDLIAGGHGRSDVAQRAARELEDIAQVATCLYAEFGEVLPSIRLDWAERLSQYDAPVNLRNLSSLPRWGDLALPDRRELQSLADWLFQRVDARRPEAVGLINDLVRVCILLASHAPVNQIIAGRVPKPTTVSVGGRVDLAILAAHLPKVRIGMHVLMYAGNDVVARGVVEDLAAGQAAARVVEANGATVQLERDARVQFAEPAAFDRNPLTMAERLRIARNQHGALGSSD